MPPLTGTAVNVTGVPEQMFEDVAVMLTAGLSNGLMARKMLFEKAVEVVTQLALLVSTLLTTSPFARATIVYAALFIPTFTPFNFH